MVPIFYTETHTLTSLGVKNIAGIGMLKGQFPAVPMIFLLWKNSVQSLGYGIDLMTFFVKFAQFIFSPLEMWQFLAVLLIRIQIRVKSRMRMRVPNPHPHQSGKSDPDPHQSGKSDPDPYQSEKRHPNPGSASTCCGFATLVLLLFTTFMRMLVVRYWNSSWKWSQAIFHP